MTDWSPPAAPAAHPGKGWSTKKKVVVGAVSAFIVVAAIANLPSDTKEPATPPAGQAYSGFIAEQADFSVEVGEKLGGLSDAAESGDIAGAARLSTDLWSLFANAERAPSGYPWAREHDAMMDTCENAYDLVSDAFITLDANLLDQASGLIEDCNDTIVAYTDSIVEATG